jgi:hypothetical protein
LPVKMRRGEPHRCHGNAADLWAHGTEKCQLVTGYALAGGVWLSHSWVVEDKNLYETAEPFDRYFGAALGPLLAWKFWVENFSLPRFGDSEPPPGFWEERPGLVNLSRTIAEMPPDVYRRLLTAESLGRTA